MEIRVNPAGYVYVEAPLKVWLPPINAKQFEIFNDRHRYLLVHGPRKSGKTFGIIHKVIRHAFDVNGAMVAIVCKTIKNAKSAGVWVLLERMLNYWADPTTGCPGFAIVEGPKMAGDSKMSFVRIRNRHGGVSEIQCHSMERSNEVEAKFKGPAYSMFWLSEFDQYCDANAFDILCDALRMTPLVPYEDHQIICDCNPPETGEDNWIHDKWFKFKDRDPESEDDKIFWDGLHRILVNIDDNPQLHDKERRELVARYKKRPNLYARFILGQWKQDITDGHFSDLWDADLHVMGNADSPNESEWEVVLPTEACTSLLTGWDIGDSKNHSFHILEKTIHVVKVTDPKTNQLVDRFLVSFSVLDEFAILRTFMSVKEFTEKCMKKMDVWEKFILKRNPTAQMQWRHWSDTSAFDFKASANSSDAAIVYETSGDRIVLQPAPKYAGSRHDRVNLIGELLSQQRLLISAQLSYTKSMMVNLRKGTTAAEFIKDDDWRHGFDSMSYPIIAEAPMDMKRSSSVGTGRKNEVDGLVIAR